MFGKKKKRIQPNLDYQYVLSKIKYNVNPPSKTYEVTADEEKFINALMTYIKYKQHNPRMIRLVRLADGTFNVTLADRFLGKVRLQGKKKFILFMKDQYTPETIYGETADDLIPHISKWI